MGSTAEMTGAELRKAREAADLTQAELAAKIAKNFEELGA